MSDTILLVMSINCVRMTSLELTNGMSIWEDVGGLWPYYLLTVTLCEKFVSIPAEKRHLISAHGASFALVLEMAKSLSHVFISYNELHPGILLNKSASEIALFITPRRCCNCVPSRWMSLFSQWWCFFFFFFSPYPCSWVSISVHRQRPSPARASNQRQKQKVRPLDNRLLLHQSLTCGFCKCLSTVFGIYNHANMRCFSFIQNFMFFFVLILMTFRRDSPSSPPSKKSKGLGPRNTIDKFFRWWSNTQNLHPHLEELGEFSTGHLWPPAFILLGWFKSHYRLHGSNCPHCR